MGNYYKNVVFTTLWFISNCSLSKIKKTFKNKLKTIADLAAEKYYKKII